MQYFTTYNLYIPTLILKKITYTKIKHNNTFSHGQVSAII